MSENPPEIEVVIQPATRDLGDGFTVRRALPSIHRRMVGPFIFFDQMGPAIFRDGQGLDVRPHPHIGLSTVTYLLEGEILHRDSLGTVQPIRPGAVNWMTAGKGIVHSERTPAPLRHAGEKLFGVQIWVALPKRHEETAPSFVHTPKEALPVIDDGNATLRVIAGTLFGKRSPVQAHSELFYGDLTLGVGGTLKLDCDADERAGYVIEGEVTIAGARFGAGQLVVFAPGAEIVIAAEQPARLLLFGGEPSDGPRHIWWNFVSSSRERMEAAKQDWREQKLGQVPGETEFIPLPDDHPTVAKYP